MARPIALFCILFLASPSAVAEEIYHCVGKYNTGVGYDHVYTVKKVIGGEILFWETQKFQVHPDLGPELLYATYVGSTGVDVLFIDTDRLRAEFSSIRYGTPFFASGSCKKIK